MRVGKQCAIIIWSGRHDAPDTDHRRVDTRSQKRQRSGKGNGMFRKHQLSSWQQLRQPQLELHELPAVSLNAH
ncbi:hypothetical protein BJF89_13415 [Corynebacterium sp. CNJ-954]|nr:hypothetical protein BJF89_13415 [Corynebacterium sp. CNJ-954]